MNKQKSTWQRLSLAVSLTILGLWLLAACTGFFLPDLMPPVNLETSLAGMSWQHWLGTDALGRPLAPMLLLAAKTAFIISILSITIAASMGVAFGTLAGYLGGWVDQSLMRLVDLFLAFPGILLAIVLTAVLGPSTTNIIFALAFLGWTSFARIARGQTLMLKHELFIDGAKVMGLPTWRIILRHLIPNLLPPIVVQTSLALAGAILAESSLSFLGLGDPTQPSWGSLLADGVEYLRLAPYLSIFPGLVLSMVVLALNIVGDDLASRYHR